MNDEAVYRTAPATPGLLITKLLSSWSDPGKKIAKDLVVKKTTKNY